jgi:hypothetical protein
VDILHHLIAPCRWWDCPHGSGIAGLPAGTHQQGWYENAQSLADKIGLARSYSGIVGGVGAWTVHGLSPLSAEGRKVWDSFARYIDQPQRVGVAAVAAAMGTAALKPASLHLKTDEALPSLQLATVVADAMVADANAFINWEGGWQYGGAITADGLAALALEFPGERSTHWLSTVDSYLDAYLLGPARLTQV